MASAPRFPTFYIDDSSCEIAGRKHVILAGVAYDDEDSVIAEWLALKSRYNLLPTDEVKWNSRQLPIEVRREFIPVASQGTGIAVMADSGKQSASLDLTKQLSKYCEERGHSGYRCRFDRDIICSWRELQQHCSALTHPCVGMSEADSNREQLLQCADFLAGAIKLGISFGTGVRDPNKLISLKSNVGDQSSEPEECELGWFLFGSLRYCIWGETAETSSDPNQYIPIKTTFDRGIVIRSSLPENVHADVTGALDGFYMGCIH